MGLEDSPPPRAVRPWLRLADQACCAVVITGSLAAMLVAWFYQGGWSGRLIDVEKARSSTVPFQLDMNRADWPEWSVLPGIGEMLARRIVESRQRDGPFRDPEDLLRVRGIGPHTLERLRPYLLPVDRLAQRAVANRLEALGAVETTGMSVDRVHGARARME